MFLFLLLLFPPTNSFDHHDCTKFPSSKQTNYVMCDYMKRFGKEYSHKDDFLVSRKLVFHRTNIKSSKNVNFGLNSISDRKFYQNKHLKHKSPILSKHNLQLSSYHLPDELDLREKMQPVKDQGE